MSIHIDKLAVVLDRSGRLPLYHQLKRWVANRVLSGEMPPGTRLPDEMEICSSLGVSRGVVRQALTELVYEGMLVRQRGRGTFVSVPKTAEGLISGLRGLSDDAALRGQQVDSRVLSLREVAANEAAARQLKVPAGEPVVELERLRRVDGEPHVLVTSYLVSAMVPGLASQDFNGPASLYKVLREQYELPVVSGVRRVEATLARAREAGQLEVRRGAPLLLLTSVSFTTGERPLEYFVALHRGDRTAFEVGWSRPAGNASHFAEVASRDGSRP